jgi:hypothetical protein
VPIELLTTSEVAEVLGVSPRRVAQLADQRLDFPEPYAVTRGVKRARGMRLWKPDDIDQWKRNRTT